MDDDQGRTDEGAEDQQGVTGTDDSVEDGESAQEVDAAGEEGEDSPEWLEDFDAEKAQRRIKKIQAENKSLRGRAKDAETSKDDLSTRNEKLTSRNMALEVGLELGLPERLVDRLRGSTRDEMLVDAQALLALMGGGGKGRKPAENLRGAASPEREPEETDLSKIGARMFRNHN